MTLKRRTTMSSIFKRSTMGLGIGGAVLLTVATSLARITWDLQPAGTGAYDWTLTQHWTFNVTGGGDSNLPSCSNHDCSYHPIGDNTYGGNTVWGPNAAPECLELTTWPGTLTTNPDTVIEVLDPATNSWKYISDDYGNTFQSHARVWFEAAGTASSFLRVRAYSSYRNSDDFQITITRRDLTKAQCTNGQTAIPWVQISQPTTTPPTVVVTMSTFH
jgi:hypothetical protein